MFKTARRMLICLLVASVSLFGIAACGDDGGSGGNNGGTNNGGTNNGGTNNGGTNNGGTNNGGTNNGGGGGSLDYSVDGSKELGSLSESEAQTLCDESSSFTEETITRQDSCTFQGAVSVAFADPQPETDEEAQQTCVTARDQCLNQDPGEQTCETPPADCTATVDELEACLNAQVSKIEQVFSSTPACEDLTLSDAQDAADEVQGLSELPAECDAVEQKCPSMFDGS